MGDSMKITRRQLRDIIREEMSRLNEGIRIEGGSLDTSLLDGEAWWPQLKAILSAMNSTVVDTADW
jgi:hypothetical protein